MEKDFSIKVTVRNGRLLRAIRKNFESVAEFSRCLGRSGTAVNNLVTMRVKPFTNNGWTELALDVSALAGEDPEDLWPEYMREVSLQRATAELNADLSEVQAITQSKSPEKQIAQLDAVRQLVSGLTPRELQVLERRFVEGATLQETADELNISQERLRQIEAKTLRKMKSRAVRNGFVKRYEERVVTRELRGMKLYGTQVTYTSTDYAKALLADEE
jgi:RNA polymerase sigma factor (sigma-70 family)